MIDLADPKTDVEELFNKCVRFWHHKWSKDQSVDDVDIFIWVANSLDVPIREANKVTDQLIMIWSKAGLMKCINDRRVR